jgi:TIR domain
MIGSVEIGEPRSVPGADRLDFFISYTTTDQVWAEWIAWQLEAAGYKVKLQAWDMVAGSNWSVAMQDYVRYASRTIAVLSDAYLESMYGRLESQAALVADPGGVSRKLLPVRVENCARPGLLGQVVSVDLFGLSAQDARDRLLIAVRAAVAGRAKPVSEPAYPGPALAPIPPPARPARPAPAFPGHSSTLGRAARARRAPTRPAHVDRQRFRALLVGVSTYEDERLPSLPGLSGDIGSAAEALERVGYRTDVHDSSRTSASAIKAAIQAFISGAASDETLLVLLAGNGVHHEGRDYLVPSDAFVGYQPFWDLCVPIDWTATISRSPAQNVLVLVDAAGEYDADTRRLVTDHGWGTGPIADAGARDVAYIFCEPSRPGARSPLTRALADVLTQEPVPDTLAGLRNALAGQVGDAGALRSVALCDPERFLPFPGSRSTDASADSDHPWREVASRHFVWPLVADCPAADSLQDATLALVSQLGRDRDRTAGRLESDPWTRPGLARRMTRRVEFLLTRLAPEGKPLSAAEAALLVAIPFLHEALWTRLAAEASLVRPADLEFRARSGDPDRAEFEDFARRYPRLLRRAERAQRTGSRQPIAAIGWWLLHRWIASRPQSYQSGTLTELLGGPDPGSLIAEVFHERRVGELLKALRSGPTFLGRSERLTVLPDAMTVGSATPDEQPLRGRLVAFILAVGQRMALEPNALPDVIVEHLGVADPVDLEELHTTIQQAVWQQQGRATRTLAAQCQHQAVQVAFEQHTKTLDALLGEVHRATADLPPLSMLPTHATAQSVRAAEVDGRPTYSRAGAQFRLAEDRVQELLMGDELYNNRALAIRELYQNALDACRYRRAREEYLERTTGERSTWTGRIEFRQGFDADGNAYIECQDNGIGMGMRELTDVFAEAGTRSVDMPEVVEEMVVWEACDPPIRFYANGRFGIGVLSYFMLADEITVDTCRVGRDGRPGDRLHVTIAGPGNLFRVQNLGPGTAGGTTVRLHLARQSGGSVVSCVDILRRVLWVAEFATVAVDGGSVQHWLPGTLADAAPVGDSNPMVGSIYRQTMQILETDFPLWWCNGQGAMLSDGLWAGKAVFGVVANLTGTLAPELSVDRNSIRKLRNEPAVDALLIDAVPALLRGSSFELTME